MIPRSSPNTCSKRLLLEMPAAYDQVNGGILPSEKIPRKEQSLYSSEGSELELVNELGDYYENEKAWPQAYSRRGVNSAVS